jgi:hypothetical protein
MIGVVTMNLLDRAPVVVLALAWTLVLVPTAFAADSLPKALQAKGKQTVQDLKKLGYTNVGVLKFLVRQGDGPARDNVGDLNLSLAHRFEKALILAVEDPNFAILSNPSQAIVEMKLRAANHLDESGRKAFFRRKFKIDYTGDEVVPAVFVTGLATLAPNQKVMTIQFQYFDQSAEIKPLPGGDVVVALDPTLIAEAGMSYALSQPMQRALVTGGPKEKPKSQELVQEAIKQAEATRSEVQKPKEEPFAPITQSPVKWSILYNGTKTPITSDRVAEPSEKDKVEFLLENPTEETYAVVLLVNGVNTLYHEKIAVTQCRKWVLPPNSSVLVRGFQSDTDEAEPFRVLSPERSVEESVNYGAHAGTFRMVVYHGTLSEMPIREEKAADNTLLAIANTRIDGTGSALPQSLKAHQADILGRSAKAGRGRGLIVKGTKKERFETQQVHFQATTDVPVADISLRYYDAGK